MSNTEVVQNPAAIFVGAFEELGAAMLKFDPAALKKQSSMAIPTRISMLKSLANTSPQHAPIINQLMLPALQKHQGIAAAAATAAAARRVKDSADLLDTATHIIPVSGDAVTTGTTITAEVTTPFSGQPWRYLDLFGATGIAVGVRLSVFKLASLDHIVTDNVAYSVTPSDKGIDLSQFYGTNILASQKPRYTWRPWGLKRSGVIRPEAKINLAVSNRSGATTSWYLGLMVQASPCGEDSAYTDNREGVYKRQSKQSRTFFKKLLGFSLYQ